MPKLRDLCPEITDSGSSSASYEADEPSYDEHGQPKMMSYGQGLPVDKYGCYIRRKEREPEVSPVPVGDKTVLVSDSVTQPASERSDDLTFRPGQPLSDVIEPQNMISAKTPQSLGIVHKATESPPPEGHSRLFLKRRQCDDDSVDSLPQTPCRIKRGGQTLRLINTNTPSQGGSSPSIRTPRAPKQRRLRTPFKFAVSPITSRMASLEGAMKVLQEDAKIVLEKQTGILYEILDVLREGTNTQNRMSSITSRMDNLESATQVMQRDVKAALARQTSVLTEILDTLCDGNSGENCQ